DDVPPARLRRRRQPAQPAKGAGRRAGHGALQAVRSLERERGGLMALLETVDVNVRFGGHHAVRDVNLEVEAGRVTGLIGPNGAGKTTTFNAITGLQETAGGKVILDG